jgi:hypothetical protein
VCGEVIFRGDECVSLGWCFWHKACYGCLLCGSRLIDEGVPVRELYGDGGGNGTKGTEGEGGGREASEVPLCAACVVDAEIDDLSREQILERGLERIGEVDKGLTACRRQDREVSHNRSTPTTSLEAHEQVSGMSPRRDGLGESVLDGAYS